MSNPDSTEKQAPDGAACLRALLVGAVMVLGGVYAAVLGLNPELPGYIGWTVTGGAALVALAGCAMVAAGAAAGVNRLIRKQSGGQR